MTLSCGDGGADADSDSGASSVTTAGTSQPITSTTAGSESGSDAGTDPSGTGSSDSSTATDATESTTESTSDPSTTEVIYDVGNETTTDATTDPTGDPEMGCKKVDLLFVIDDSGSMTDEQNKLTAAFPSLMETIDQELVQEKNIDYRVGVISTDMATQDMCIFMLICGQGHLGRLQHHADRLNGCAEPPGKWIEQGPIDEVSAQFQCIASMDGGEFNEMPLEAARAGLVDRVIDNEAYNSGFLRDDALLVLVIFTDEDDQSVWEVQPWDPFNPFGPGQPTPVIQYWQKFVDLKGGEPDRFVTVVFSGPKNTSCGDVMNDNGAVQAPRLHQFLELNLTNAYWGSICEDDFTTPLHEALDVIESICEVFPPPV
ncbi:MAG: hypothetical protein R3A51_01680 [Nannocystaceae bacterium]|nr:hypothetical protein [Myxococcales bacterium]